LLITGDFDSHADFLFRLERALQRGIRLVQLRCSSAPPEQFRDLAQLAKTLCEQYQATLLCNTTPDNFSRCAGDGLHLNSHELRSCESRPIEGSKLLGASCHNAEEIQQALHIGVDYVCLSPVAPTSSHPNAAVLGWEKFAELVQNTGVPVFALGGMDGDDIEIAKAHGGQGIAAISCFWNK
jgi:8-oxo-dGTP diphosphatase